MSAEDLGFLPLSDYDFHDTHGEGLAVRMLTEPSPQDGQARFLRVLLDADSGVDFLRALSNALAQAFPDQVQKVF